MYQVLPAIISAFWIDGAHDGRGRSDAAYAEQDHLGARRRYFRLEERVYTNRERSVDEMRQRKVVDLTSDPPE